MARYTYRTGKIWLHADTGRRVSIYGAGPCWGDPYAQGWTIAPDGFHVEDGNSGAIIRRFGTEAEAAAFCNKNNAEWSATLAKHERDWAPVKAPINWSRSKGNDGVIRHHSGEGYSIAKVGDWYAVESGAEDDLPCYRSLAKAKGWAERMIRSERSARMFD